MILGLLDEAIAAGARQRAACEVLDIDPRTVERWREQDIGEDRRAGPRTPPSNKISDHDRRIILEVVNSPEFRDLPPSQIVPILADRGVYIASEKTIYRILREEKQNQHREASRPRTPRETPRELVATAPNQVWSWDITYLPTTVRGIFYYLYMTVDVFSRKIVGWAVHDHEDNVLAAALIQAVCDAEGVTPGSVTLHADNGGPMKGSTMLATLQALGVATSFSRPRVSNDNAFSEALFRTLKYRPEYPTVPFASLEAARCWVTEFVDWYNLAHRHSGIRFVTPAERHAGKDIEILARRRQVYEHARRRFPQRWSRDIRNWTPVAEVRLNPAPHHVTAEVA